MSNLFTEAHQSGTAYMPHVARVQPWARCAARLLRGPLFDDEEELWHKLSIYKTELIMWFEQIAVELIIDQRDGYAYLKQLELDDKGNTVGLVQRRPLSYEVTLLCVILRKMLDEFELNDTSNRNLYITRKLLRVELETFFKEKANRMKPIADKYGLTLLQFASIWNLSHPAVESVVPTFIQEAGEGARPIEDKIREFAALPDLRLTPEEVEAVRAIGDNTGCMMLKGASKRHQTSERPDEWPMREDLLELAGRYGLGSDW